MNLWFYSGYSKWIWLSILDNLNYVSEFKDISLEEIYSVATLYNQFKLEPKGKYEINICLGTVCYVKGSDEILKK